MSQILNQNQFTATAIKGDVALKHKVITVRYNQDATVPLYTGDVVKIITKTASQIIVDKAAVSDIPYGVHIYNIKKQSISPGGEAEIACLGTTVWLEVSEAINAGAKVEFDPTTITVKTSAGTNKVLGYALTTVSASGQLVLVDIGAPYITVA